MENWVFVLVIAFGLLVLILSSGLWISVSAGIVGIIVLLLFTDRGLGMLGYLQFNNVNSYVWVQIPLYTFMGYLILASGLSKGLYQGATAWVGWFPGGLLHTNVAACAVFGAIAGASLPAVTAVGVVAIPELEKRGYNRKLAFGSVAASATLSSMIPPSLALVIYGALVDESVGRLFMGGVFPGLLEAALYMGFIAVVCVIRPSLTPHRTRFSPKAIVLSIVDIWPAVVLIFMVLGSIYLGVATPTEAAAMGAVGALFFCALFRKLTWQAVKEASLFALTLTSWTMIMLIGIQILSAGLGFLKVAENLAAWVVSLEFSRVGIFAAIGFMYLVLGMFVTSFAMMFLTLPVVYPLMMSLGFDSVWFGIVLVVFMEVAVITPPVGAHIYILNGLTGRRHLSDIIIGCIPFALLNVVQVAILYAFPSIVLWLPSKMISKL